MGERTDEGEVETSGDMYKERYKKALLFSCAGFSLTCWMFESLAVSVGPLDMMAGLESAR